MSEYSPAVLEHFRRPRGAGRLAESESGTIRGDALDASGGQRVRLHLQISPSQRIARARFQAFGCPITIAAASAAVARLEGATIAAALLLRADELALELALTPEQAHLAELPLAALRDGLARLGARG